MGPGLRPPHGIQVEFETQISSMTMEYICAAMRCRNRREGNRGGGGLNRHLRQTILSARRRAARPDPVQRVYRLGRNEPHVPLVVADGPIPSTSSLPTTLTCRPLPRRATHQPPPRRPSARNGKPAVAAAHAEEARNNSSPGRKIVGPPPPLGRAEYGAGPACAAYGASHMPSILEIDFRAAAAERYPWR